MSAKAYEALSKSNELTSVNETAQSPKQNNDVDEKEMKKRKKAALIKFGSLAVFAFIVWIFATISWFSSNDTTTADGMGVSVGNAPFTLASTGSNSGAVSYKKSGSKYDSTLVNDLDGAIDADEGSPYTYDNTTYYTAGNADTILWNLTDNYDPTDEGIHPDSSGSFTFYLIPNVDTAFTANITLHIDGYTATVNKNAEKENTPLEDYNGTFQVDNLELIEDGDDEYTAVQYLNRRLLFFGGGAKGSYTTLYDNKTISLSYTDDEVTPGVPIPVTVQWIWPKTFAQMACIADSGNITNDSTTQSAIRRYIVAEPNLLLAASKISRADALAKMADPDTVGDETTYTFNSTKANTNVIALSEGYNVADNTVGKDVQYFLLSITAE